MSEVEKASQAKTDRYAEDAKHIRVKRVGDTEFRSLDELEAQDRELAEAMHGNSKPSETEKD